MLQEAIAKPGRDARPACPQSRGMRDPAKCAEGFVIASEVESPNVKSPTADSLKVKNPTVESPEVKRPTVESLKVKNPTVEGLKVESRKSEVASVVNPVSVVSVERPMVVTVDTVVHGNSVVRSADEKLVVASPERPKAPVIAASEKQTAGI